MTVTKKKTLLATLAFAACGLLLAACGGDSNSDSGSDSTTTSTASDVAGNCKELNLYTWEGEDPSAIVKPFEEKYGVKVNASYMASEDQALAKLASGGTEQYDVVTAVSDNRLALKDADLIKPLDTGQLEHLDSIFPFLKEPFEVDGEVWAISADWATNPFIYNTDDFAEEPTSWEVLWDPKLKDQIGLWNDYSMLYVGAAVLGYENIFDMSDEQLDKIKTKMLELAPNTRKVWSTGGDLIQLYANGEVTASMGWDYVANQLEGKVPVKKVVFENMGGQAWSEGPALTSGIDSECEPLAYAWINELTSPEGQAALAEATGYTPSNPEAQQYMSNKLIKQTGIDNPDSVIEGAVIRLDPVNRQKYVDTTQQIVAGLG